MKSEYMRARRLRFIASQMCAMCGRLPPLPNLSKCEVCKVRETRTPPQRKRAARTAAILREVRVLRHECQECGLKCWTRLCEPCKVRKYAKVQEIKTRWATEGLCVRCGGNRDDEYKSCSPCRYRKKVLRVLGAGALEPTP